MEELAEIQFEKNTINEGRKTAKQAREGRYSATVVM